MGLFLGSLFCSTETYVYFYANTICFDYYSFVVLSEVWKGVPLALFFFLRIALAILGPL